jgi:seryl-tRNA synthetase
MTAAAESVLQALDLPYRKMLLCAGDMGFTARITYDLEVWLPGQGAYREILVLQLRRFPGAADERALSSRRRERHRIRPHAQRFGPGRGRTLVAVLENYQQEDGRSKCPPCWPPTWAASPAWCRS